MTMRLQAGQCVAALCLAVGMLTPLSTLNLEGDTHHVQGIDVDDAVVWVSSVDAKQKRGLLFEFDRATGRMLRTAEVHKGAQFHPGGISGDGDSLWIPIAEYRRNSTSTIQKRSKRTLAVVSEFAVEDHIGAVAVSREVIVGANWDAQDLYVWDHAGKLLRKLPNPVRSAFQDLKFDRGNLGAAGLLADKSGSIDWIEYPSMKPLRRVTIGTTDRGIAYTHEGMDIAGDRVWFLPEDAPSRLFTFRLNR